MSFMGSKSEAEAIIANIEMSENSRSCKGSAILAGYEHPGGAASSGASKPAGEVLMPGRLRAGINKPRTRTDSLQRKYAATGHNMASKGMKG